MIRWQTTHIDCQFSIQQTNHTQIYIEAGCDGLNLLPIPIFRSFKTVAYIPPHAYGWRILALSELYDSFRTPITIGNELSLFITNHVGILCHFSFDKIAHYNSTAWMKIRDDTSIECLCVRLSNWISTIIFRAIIADTVNQLQAIGFVRASSAHPQHESPPRILENRNFSIGKKLCSYSNISSTCINIAAPPSANFIQWRVLFAFYSSIDWRCVCGQNIL